MGAVKQALPRSGRSSGPLPPLVPRRPRRGPDAKLSLNTRQWHTPILESWTFSPLSGPQLAVPVYVAVPDPTSALGTSHSAKGTRSCVHACWSGRRRKYSHSGRPGKTRAHVLAHPTITRKIFPIFFSSATGAGGTLAEPHLRMSGGECTPALGGIKCHRSAYK